MKQERPGMMHLKKVTKTVDYYSCGLSGDARSRRGEARRPGFPLSAADAPGRGGAGPAGQGSPGRPRGPPPGEGLAPLPTQSPRLERAAEGGGGGRGHRPPRPGPALGTRGRAAGAGEGHPQAQVCARSRPGRFVRNLWPLRRPSLPPTGGPGASASDPPRPPGPPPETEGRGEPRPSGPAAGSASVPRGRCPGTRGGKGGQEGRRPLSPASRASAWA